MITTRFPLAVLPALLGACTNLDSLGPSSVRSVFVARLSTTVPRSEPPDVGGARAAEAAALSDIEVHLGPESRNVILAALTGDHHDGFTYGVKGRTAEWQARYDRFYAA